VPLLLAERALVHDFEVNQSGAASLFIVDHIRHRRIAVRPAAVELINMHCVRAAIFSRGRLQHLLGERVRVHVVPQAAARQFIFNDGARIGHGRAKTIAVQHLKTLCFPTLPLPYLAYVANVRVGQAEIDIDQIGDAFAVNIPPFYNDGPATPHLFRDRIDL